MDIARARYLLSERGRAALAGLRDDLPIANPTRLATELRRSFAADEASALAEQLTLRRRAVRNHGDHRDFLFTADGLEMMTHPLVAERRAARLGAAGRAVLDLTCGIGGDLSAVARRGSPCAGVDLDLAHAMLAAANSGAPVVRGDALRAPFELRVAAVVIDPSRREGDTRRFNPAAFAPRWDDALALAASAATAVVKAPPGLAAAYIPAGTEVEAVQLGTSMREMAIWFGVGAKPGVKRAVLLPSGLQIESTDEEASEDTRPPRSIIYDPESCVTRAVVVRQLGHQLGAWLLDPHIAYLSSDVAAFSPFAATFEVLDALPFSVARLKQRLRENRWRPDEVRRRGFPIDPDELRKLLGKLEGEPVTLLLTTLESRKTVFICRRLFAPA